MWWSNFYSLPLKDPRLQEYTLEELAYEYYAHNEFDKAKAERIEQENDKIDVEQHEDAVSWADQMEADELDEKEPAPDPSKDADNIEWMEKQMEEAKAIYGDDFGEDISEDFE